MENAVSNLLRSSSIPEVGSDVTAGASTDIHLTLISVMALRALPNKLAVFLNDLNLSIESAFHAIIGFSIEFCVYDVVIDESHNLKHSRNVVLHVGDFNIANCQRVDYVLLILFNT